MTTIYFLKALFFSENKNIKKLVLAISISEYQRSKMFLSAFGKHGFSPITELSESKKLGSSLLVIMYTSKDESPYPCHNLRFWSSKGGHC